MPSEPTLENPHYACPVCLSAEDPDYWQKHLELARRARIGELVESVVRQLSLSDTLRLYPTVYHKDHSEVCVELVRTCDNVPDKSATDTLLAALEALAKAIGGDDE